MSDTYNLSDNVEFLYILSSVIIVLVILLLSQYFFKHDNHPKGNYKMKKNTVVLNTPKGLIPVDNNVLIGEFKNIRDFINETQGLADVKNVELNNTLDHTIGNLAEFLQKNGIRDKDLVVDPITKNLSLSIHPEFSVSNEKWKTILEHEDNERKILAGSRDKIRYLINVINLIVQLLEEEGHNMNNIDLSSLYELINKIISRSQHKGLIKKKVELKQMPRMGLFLDAYKAVDYDEINTMDYKEAMYIEPFAVNKINANNRIKKNKTTRRIYSSVLDKDAVQLIGDLKGNNNFEGLAQFDIMVDRTPGSIIQELEKIPDAPSRFYTTNVNSCLGNSYDDNDLAKNCVSEDLKLRDALDGRPSKLLDCLSQCDDPINSARFYNTITRSNYTVSGL
jgi:hypothetical protein